MCRAHVNKHNDRKMSTNDSEAVNGIPLFLLKTKSSPFDGYAERFSSSAGDARFAPTFVPVLEHQLIDEGMDVVRELLREKQIGRGQDKKYGGMIFTSQRAVEAFTKLVEEVQGMFLNILRMVDHTDWTTLTVRR